ncbi:unnamed protein product, partial [Protopolystoma xenopodis]
SSCPVACNGRDAEHDGTASEVPRRQQISARPDVCDPSPLLGLADAEYLAAWRCFIEPVATQFRPDIILVSAGFDAALGHPDALGGYAVSPACFAWMTRQDAKEQHRGVMQV